MLTQALTMLAYQLPELLAAGADRGLPTLALLRSREQGRARWPHDELPV